MGRFDLKNVKVKIPKCPHILFGRLMAKDEYFPTALGLFEIPIEPDCFVEKPKQNSDEKLEPKTKVVDVMSAWKMIVERKDERTGETTENEEFVEIGKLTLRV